MPTCHIIRLRSENRKQSIINCNNYIYSWLKNQKENKLSYEIVNDNQLFDTTMSKIKNHMSFTGDIWNDVLNNNELSILGLTDIGGKGLPYLILIKVS